MFYELLKSTKDTVMKIVWDTEKTIEENGECENRWMFIHIEE